MQVDSIAVQKRRSYCTGVGAAAGVPTAALAAALRVAVSGALACRTAAFISGLRFCGGATTNFGSSYLKPAAAHQT